MLIGFKKVNMKIALIYAHEKSNWRSCQTITENLISAYKNLFSTEHIFSLNYNSNTTDFDLWDSVKKLADEKVEKIIITDHAPHPLKIFIAIDKVFQDKKPEIIIHVFGDFTLHVKEWLKSETILKKYNVKFVCASERQARLIQSFTLSSNNNVFVCPFPVDSKQFNYSPKVRNSLRQRNMLENEKTVFVYTGRLSQQKNVLELIQSFADFVAIQNPNAVLYLAGPFDDLGSPFIGYFSKERYEYTIMKLLESFTNSESMRDKIVYIGNLSADKLFELYNMADIYISLSVHNDEDFGMAPAEALCSGLPAILTNWAGYASFKNTNVNNYCQLINVEIKEGFIKYNKAELLHSLIDTYENIETIRNQRTELALINQSNFTIQAAERKIEHITTSKISSFEGFTKLFREMEIAFQRSGSPFGIITHNFNYTELYKKIYDNYIQK